MILARLRPFLVASVAFARARSASLDMSTPPWGLRVSADLEVEQAPPSIRRAAREITPHRLRYALESSSPSSTVTS